MRKVISNYEMVKVDKLHSGLAYQRPIDMNFVREKVENFDEAEVDAPCVSVSINDLGEKEYHTIEGQHTVAIVRQKGWGEIRCEVKYNLTEEEENEWFYQKNTKKRNQTSNRLLNAQISGGFDKTTNNLISSLETVGYKIRSKDVKTKRGVINAGTSLKRVFQYMNKVDFEKCMELHSCTWAGDKKSLSISFLKGMCKFYTTYKRKLDPLRFSTALSDKKVEIDTIVKEATGDNYTQGMDLKYAKVLVKYYNKDLRTDTKRLKPSLLED